MNCLYDIYALCPERSVAAVERFLARFLPQREQAAVEYELPQYSDAPNVVFNTPEALIAYCCEHPEAEQCIYWTNPGPDARHSAHIYFLPAGGLVLGLSIWAESDAEAVIWLENLMFFAGAAHGYWTSEEPPEDTIDKFMARAQSGLQ